MVAPGNYLETSVGVIVKRPIARLDRFSTRCRWYRGRRLGKRTTHRRFFCRRSRSQHRHLRCILSIPNPKREQKPSTLWPTDHSKGDQMLLFAGTIARELRRVVRRLTCNGNFKDKVGMACRRQGCGVACTYPRSSGDRRTHLRPERVRPHVVQMPPPPRQRLCRKALSFSLLRELCLPARCQCDMATPAIE
jgi:hypothetical protein